MTTIFSNYRLALFLLLSASLAAVSFTNSSEEEVLHLRRIVEFAKEDDPGFIELEISDFIQKYPSSPFCFQLYNLMGNLKAQKGQFESSLEWYKKIPTDQLSNTARLRTIYCKIALKRFSDIVEEIDTLSKSINSLNPSQSNTFYHYAAETYFQLAQQQVATEAAISFYENAESFYQKIEKKFTASAAYNRLKTLVALNRYIEAAQFCTIMSEVDSKDREKWLFALGEVQEKFDLPLAKNTFATLMQQKGETASKSAFRFAKILYQSSEFEILIQKAEELGDLILEKDKPLFSYFLACSFFEKNEPAKVVDTLSPHIDKIQEESFLYDALFKMATAHYYLKNYLLSCEFAQKGVPLPNEKVLGLCHFILASSKEMLGEYNSALTDIAFTLEKANESSLIEQSIFLQSRLMGKIGQWEKAREGFLRLLPSRKPEVIYRELISTSKQGFTLQISQGITPQHAYQALKSDLEMVLDHSELLNIADKENYLFDLGHVLYEIGEFEKCNALLEELQETTHNVDLRARCYITLALSYGKGLNDIHKKIFYLETFLEIASDSPLAENVQYDLALANLIIADKENNTAQKHSFLKKSSEQISQLIDRNSPILENHILLWYAGYQYDCLQEYLNADWRRNVILYKNYHSVQQACSIYKNLLDERVPSDPALQGSYLKYAKLLILEQQDLLAETILEKLTSLSDSYRTVSLYELGKIYERKGKFSDALNAYEKVIHSVKIQPDILIESQWSYAYLSYHSLPLTERTLCNPQVFEALKILKSLQLKKSIETEPYHLESALEYIAIRVELTDPPFRKKEALKLLMNTRQHFTNTNDIWSKDYHNKRSELPDLDHMYQEYMLFLEERISYLQNNGDTHLAEQIRKQLQEIPIHSKFLFERIQRVYQGESIL